MSFPVRNDWEDDHLKICRLCWEQRYRGRYERYYRTRMITKMCRDCGWPLPVSRFYRDRKEPDGRSPVCKSCQDGRELRALETMRPCREMRGLRRCRMCDQIKPLDSFYKCRTMPFGHGYRCSDCARKRREELRRERRSRRGRGV
jgi:hypothetical protein